MRLTIETVRRWLIADLSADAGIATLIGSPGVCAAGDDLPSEPGIFVDVPGSSSRGRFADDCRAEVYCAADTEQGAYDLMAAVRAALHHASGEPKEWAASPADHGLRLRRVLFLDDEQPTGNEATGHHRTVFAGILRYQVKGRSVDLPD